MLKIIFFFFFVILFKQSFAQEYHKNDSANSKTIIVLQDNRLSELCETYTSTFKLMGFRIQIFSGDSKQPARDARLIFINSFNEIKAHEIYEQPYFKVRVGDFRTKIEALKFKIELTKYFPNCFIIRDEIDFKETVN